MLFCQYYWKAPVCQFYWLISYNCQVLSWLYQTYWESVLQYCSGFIKHFCGKKKKKINIHTNKKSKCSDNPYFAQLPDLLKKILNHNSFDFFVQLWPWIKIQVTQMSLSYWVCWKLLLYLVWQKSVLQHWNPCHHLSCLSGFCPSFFLDQSEAVSLTLLWHPMNQHVSAEYQTISELILFMKTWAQKLTFEVQYYYLSSCQAWKKLVHKCPNTSMNASLHQRYFLQNYP